MFGNIQWEVNLNKMVYRHEGTINHNRTTTKRKLKKTVWVAWKTESIWDNTTLHQFDQYLKREIKQEL